MTDGAAWPPPQPDTEQHADDTADDLDVGPSFASMRLDEKSRRIIEWAREIDAANGVQPTVLRDAVRLSDVQPEAVEWVWHGRIARGKITLIDGDPGLGKSLLSLDIAARLTTGTHGLTGNRVRPAARCSYSAQRMGLPTRYDRDSTLPAPM